MPIKILRIIAIYFIVTIFTIKINAQNVTFTDVAAQLGINHSTDVSFFAGGLSFCDIDGDGFEDISLSNLGSEIQILKFDGSAYTDVRAQLQISNPNRSQTLIWADFDNDGDKDFFMTSRGDPSRLFINNGNFTFTDITAAAGLTLASNQTLAAAWADYNNDGWLDLYVGNRAVDQRNYLYKNNGDGTFTDVTITAGVGDITRLPLAISFLDYNNDGWQDIYIANDLMGRNTLFRNNADDTFTDVSVESGAGVIVSGMGIAIGDYDNNGYLDIYVSNMPDGNKLLRNNGNGTFDELSEFLGVAFHKLCWGVTFFDYDNDTDLDLHVCASDGPGARGDLDNKNILYQNLGNGTFSIAPNSNLDLDSSYSYGSALADFDNNGYLDLAILNAYGTKTQLWKNLGTSNNWIKINLQGVASNRDGVGSILEFTVGSKKFIRSTHCGISYQSQNSFTETIGIGTANFVDTLKIKWPSGTIDVYTNIPASSTLSAVEGETINQQSPITFTDISSQVKLNHTFNVSYFAGGVSFVDANGDGLDDLTLSSALGANIQHLRNRGTKFKNITQTIGINETSESKSVVWVDFDNDRDKDLFICNFNGQLKLYKNNRGSFTEVALSSGFSSLIKPFTSSAWADYDLDGLLDVFITVYGDLESNILYRNNGDGTFSDVTLSSGVSSIGKMSLSAVWFDYDNDGYLDLLCANDLLSGNLLFHNNGDGTFSDSSIQSGVGLSMNCTSVAVGDYNEDGWSDIYFSNDAAGNKLLKNNANGKFTEVFNPLSLAVGKICWGANFFDYDNDMDLDLFVSVSDGPTGQGDASRQNVLFWNKGDNTFAQTIGTGIDTDTRYSYGNAVGDYNNDGYLDLVVLNANGTKSQLWKNSGGLNNWIKLKLTGSSSNRDAIGSLIKVYAGGKTANRILLSQTGYQSQNSLVQTVGIKNASVIDSIVVRWPNGAISRLFNITSNQTLSINETNLNVNLSGTELSKEKILPDEFKVFQNYPNPFNPSTTIEYQIAEPERVKLEVFNLLGENVIRLELGQQDAGFHKTQIDFTNMPSGIYLYKISAGKFYQIKKMILTK